MRKQTVEKRQAEVRNLETLKSLQTKLRAEQRELDEDDEAKLREPLLSALRMGLIFSLDEVGKEIYKIERSLRYRYAHMKVGAGRLTLMFDMEPTESKLRHKRKRLLVGWAWCGPRDQFDRAKGRMIAAGRLRKRPIHVPLEPRERTPPVSWFRGLCLEALDHLHVLGEVPTWVGKPLPAAQLTRRALEATEDFLGHLQEMLQGSQEGGLTLDAETAAKLERWRSRLSDVVAGVAGIVGER